MHSLAQPAQVLCRQPDPQHSVCGGQHCDRQPNFRFLSIVHGMWSHLCAARGGQAPALSASRGLLLGLQVCTSSSCWFVGMWVQQELNTGIISMFRWAVTWPRLLLQQCMPDCMLATVCCRGPLDLLAVQLLQDLSCPYLAHHELESV